MHGRYLVIFQNKYLIIFEKYTNQEWISHGIQINFFLKMYEQQFSIVLFVQKLGKN